SLVVAARTLAPVPTTPVLRHSGGAPEKVAAWVKKPVGKLTTVHALHHREKEFVDSIAGRRKCIGKVHQHVGGNFKYFAMFVPATIIVNGDQACFVFSRCLMREFNGWINIY